MPSVAELLELVGTSVDLEPDHYERLLRRRDRKRLNERIRAGALAIVVVVATVLALTRALNTEERTAEPRPTPFAGTVIRYTNPDPRSSGDLVAVDPNTGEVRTLASADELGRSIIDDAASSADGTWVAFEILGCVGGASGEAGLPAGIWVTNGLDEPRELMPKPCVKDLSSPSPLPYDGSWAWSPVAAQLVVAHVSAEGDMLVLVDPATGDRTHLGKAAGDVTSLTWSPDGTRIVYGAVPTGKRFDAAAGEGSIHSVAADGGDHDLLASSVGLVSGGETGAGILWSPDGTRVAITTEARKNRLYVMNADGSDLDLVAEDVVIAHTLGSPNAAWSPDGTKIAYATSEDDDWAGDPQIWDASLDASAPFEPFRSSPGGRDRAVSAPVWSPDGSRIAFRNSPDQSAPDQGERYLIANADGTGDVREIEPLRYLSWRGGWYFCECYG